MRFHFGTFTFDARTLTLARANRPVPLEPQPARALALLLARAGDVVTRDQLRAHLWGEDTHVDFDRGLAYCISELRAALNDSADNPRFVRTLPRRGFTFIAPVSVEPIEAESALTAPGDPPAVDAPTATPATAASTAASADRTPPVASNVTGSSGPPTVNAWTAAAAIVAVVVAVGAAAALMVARDRAASPMPRRPIVAVAVFENETGDAAHDRLVASVADVVVERLTAIGPSRLGVDGNAAILRRPRDARDWRAVARETGASYLVSGQLQERSGGLSLLMQLIRLDDGTHVWVGRVNRKASESLADIDDAAAARIETAVRNAVLK